MKLSEIKPNKDNPRLIRDERFKKLVKSIQDFPEMMALRPIIVDNEGVILGGNMRYRALKDLKYKEIPDEWVKRADELTEEQKRRFIIEDNVPFGEWDWDILANEWNPEELAEWGLDLPEDSISEKIITQNTTAFSRNHILISYHPDIHIEIMEAIEKFIDRTDVEIESAAN